MHFAIEMPNKLFRPRLAYFFGSEMRDVKLVESATFAMLACDVQCGGNALIARMA